MGTGQCRGKSACTVAWQRLLFSFLYLLNFATVDICYFHDQRNKICREEKGDETSPGALELTALPHAQLLAFSVSFFVLVGKERPQKRGGQAPHTAL